MLQGRVWSSMSVDRSPGNLGRQKCQCRTVLGGGLSRAHPLAVKPHAHSPHLLLSLLHVLPSALSFCFLPKVHFSSWIYSSILIFSKGSCLFYFFFLVCLLNYNIGVCIVHFSHFILWVSQDDDLIHRPWKILKRVQFSFSTFQKKKLVYWPSYRPNS